MIQFYAPDIAVNPVLPESDSHHCVKVLRAQPGQEIEVIDGKGHRYTCVLIDAHPKHAMVQILKCADHPLPWTYDLSANHRHPPHGITGPETYRNRHKPVYSITVLPFRTERDKNRAAGKNSHLCHEAITEGRDAGHRAVDSN